MNSWHMQIPLFLIHPMFFSQEPLLCLQGNSINLLHYFWNILPLSHLVRPTQAPVSVSISRRALTTADTPREAPHSSSSDYSYWVINIQIMPKACQIPSYWDTQMIRRLVATCKIQMRDHWGSCIHRGWGECSSTEKKKKEQRYKQV